MNVLRRRAGQWGVALGEGPIGRGVARGDVLRFLGLAMVIVLAVASGGASSVSVASENELITVVEDQRVAGTWAAYRFEVLGGPGGKTDLYFSYEEDAEASRYETRMEGMWMEDDAGALLAGGLLHVQFGRQGLVSFYASGGGQEIDWRTERSSGSADVFSRSWETWAAGEYVLVLATAARGSYEGAFRLEAATGTVRVISSSQGVGVPFLEDEDFGGEVSVAVERPVGGGVRLNGGVEMEAAERMYAVFGHFHSAVGYSELAVDAPEGAQVWQVPFAVRPLVGNVLFVGASPSGVYRFSIKEAIDIGRSSSVMALISADVILPE